MVFLCFAYHCWWIIGGSYTEESCKKHVNITQDLDEIELETRDLNSQDETPTNKICMGTHKKWTSKASQKSNGTLGLCFSLIFIDWAPLIDS